MPLLFRRALACLLALTALPALAQTTNTSGLQYFSLAPSQSVLLPTGTGCLQGNGAGTTPFYSTCPGGTAGITQLTGDVTAGPGSGSQAASVVKVNGAAVPTSLPAVGTNSSGQIVAASEPVYPQTGTSYTTSSSDCGAQDTFNNASAVAVTLTNTAQCQIDLTNIGAGTATVTPTSGTINGSSNLTIAQNRQCTANYDGTNWQVIGCTALTGGGSGTVNTGTTNQVAYYASSGTAISGATTLPTAAMPALTGDVTNTAGSLATTVGKVNGATIPASNTTGNCTNSSSQIVACVTVTYLLDEGTKFTVASGTGACASTSTTAGGTTVGSLKCTGTSGASTVVITLPSAPNGIWKCGIYDQTTTADTWSQSGNTATSVTFSGTAVANDVLVFGGCTGS